MKLAKILILLMFILLFANVVNAEKTVKTIEIPISYVAQPSANTDYITSIDLSPSDGISEIVSIEIIIRGDFQASTQINGRVKKDGSVYSCNPSSWTTPSIDSPGYEAVFDCTDKANSINWLGGEIEIGFRTDKVSQNVNGKMKVTYYNKPEITAKVFGTEYLINDTTAKTFIRLLDDSKSPVENASCFVSIYYPDTTIFINNSLMNYLEKGIHYYDLTTPDIEGVYMVSTFCDVPATANTTLAYDDLEEGNDEGGLFWSGSWYRSNDTSCSISTSDGPFGSYHIIAYEPVGGDDCNTHREANLSGEHDRVYMTFYAKADSLETGNYCKYYYYNGTDYFQVMNLTEGDDDDSYRFYSFEVKQSYGVSDNSQVRLQATVDDTGDNDRCYMDNVRFVGAYDFNETQYERIIESGEIHVTDLTRRIWEFENRTVVGNVSVDFSELIDYLVDINATTKETRIYVEDINTTIVSNFNSLTNDIDNNEQILLAINASLKSEIEGNELILLALNVTLEDILNRVQNTLEPNVLEILTNISSINIDLDTIIDNTDTLEAGQSTIISNLTSIILNVDALQSNFSDVLTDIADLDLLFLAINGSISNRLTSLDDDLDDVILEVGYIGEKLDCNHTTNIVCDRLDAIKAETTFINSTLTTLNNYVNGAVTSYLQNINATVTGIDGNTSFISSVVNTIQSNVTQILNNWGSLTANDLLTAITEVNTSVALTQNWLVAFNSTEEARHDEVVELINNLSIDLSGVNASIDSLTTLVNNVNVSIIDAINGLDFSVNLSEINFSEVIDFLEALNVTIQDTNTNVNDIEILVQAINSTSLDILTLSQSINLTVLGIEGNVTAINTQVSSLQANISDILAAIESNISLINQTFSSEFDDLTTLITSVNSTFDLRFDSIDTTISSILTEVTNIENKLDCNHTTNVICDRLDFMNSTLIEINDSLTLIEEEILVNISNQIAGVNVSIGNLSLNVDLSNVTDLISSVNDTLFVEITDISTDLLTINNTLNSLSTTVNDIDTNVNSVVAFIQDNAVFTVTDFDRVIITKNYTVEVTMFELNGSAVVPDSIPKITIRDATNSTVASFDSMTEVHAGVYRYIYQTTNSSVPGTWYAEILIEHNGEDVYVYDRWYLVSSPTLVDVEITNVCPTEVCADITIENEGDLAYEYPIYYWTTDTLNEFINGAGVIDSGMMSKLLNPGESYTFNTCLEYADDTDSTHYFYAMTDYGEQSFGYDTHTNNIVSCRLGSTPSLGGVIERVKSLFIQKEEIPEETIIPCIPDFVTCSFIGIFLCCVVFLALTHKRN